MNDEWEEHIKLYKKWCKRGLKILESVKRPREEEEPALIPVPDPIPIIEPTPTPTQKEELFFCEGHVWENPRTPCPGGEKSYIKDGIRYQSPGDEKSKIYVVCRGCKNARDREKKKTKKE